MKPAEKHHDPRRASVARKQPTPPEPIFTNRFGLTFGESRNPTTYAASGRRWRGYYKFVCLRCGWGFCRPRHKAHRLEDCDLVLAQIIGGDRDMIAFVRANLFGTRRRRRRK